MDLRGFTTVDEVGEEDPQVSTENFSKPATAAEEIDYINKILADIEEKDVRTNMVEEGTTISESALNCQSVACISSSSNVLGQTSSHIRSNDTHNCENSSAVDSADVNQKSEFLLQSEGRTCSSKKKKKVDLCNNSATKSNEGMKSYNLSHVDDILTQADSLCTDVEDTNSGLVQTGLSTEAHSVSNLPSGLQFSIDQGLHSVVSHPHQSSSSEYLESHLIPISLASLNETESSELSHSSADATQVPVICSSENTSVLESRRYSAGDDSNTCVSGEVISEHSELNVVNLGNINNLLNNSTTEVAQTIENAAEVGGPQVNLLLVKSEPIDPDPGEDFDYGGFLDDPAEEFRVKEEPRIKEEPQDFSPPPESIDQERAFMPVRIFKSEDGVTEEFDVPSVRFLVEDKSYSREEVTAALIISQSSLAPTIEMDMFPNVGATQLKVNLNRIEEMVLNPDQLVLEDADIIRSFVKNYGTSPLKWKQLFSEKQPSSKKQSSQKKRNKIQPPPKPPQKNGKKKTEKHAVAHDKLKIILKDGKDSEGKESSDMKPGFGSTLVTKCKDNKINLKSDEIESDLVQKHVIDAEGVVEEASVKKKGKKKKYEILPNEVNMDNLPVVTKKTDVKEKLKTTCSDELGEVVNKTSRNIHEPQVCKEELVEIRNENEKNTGVIKCEVNNESKPESSSASGGKSNCDSGEKQSSAQHSSQIKKYSCSVNTVNCSILKPCTVKLYDIAHDDKYRRKVRKLLKLIKVTKQSESDLKKEDEKFMNRHEGTCVQKQNECDDSTLLLEEKWECGKPLAGVCKNGANTSDTAGVVTLSVHSDDTVDGKVKDEKENDCKPDRLGSTSGQVEVVSEAETSCWKRKLESDNERNEERKDKKFGNRSLEEEKHDAGYESERKRRKKDRRNSADRDATGRHKNERERILEEMHQKKLDKKLKFNATEVEEKKTSMKPSCTLPSINTFRIPKKKAAPPPASRHLASIVSRKNEKEPLKAIYGGPSRTNKDPRKRQEYDINDKKKQETGLGRDAGDKRQDRMVVGEKIPSHTGRRREKFVNTVPVYQQNQVHTGASQYQMPPQDPRSQVFSGLQPPNAAYMNVHGNYSNPAKMCATGGNPFVSGRNFVPAVGQYPYSVPPPPIIDNWNNAGVQPPQGVNIAGVQPPQGVNIAPVQPPQRVNIAPVQPSQGAIIAPVQPSQGANIALVQPPQRMNIAPVQPSQGAIIAPVQPPQRVNIAPVQPSQGANVAPVQPPLGSQNYYENSSDYSPAASFGCSEPDIEESAIYSKRSSNVYEDLKGTDKLDKPGNVSDNIIRVPLVDTISEDHKHKTDSSHLSVSQASLSRDEIQHPSKLVNEAAKEAKPSGSRDHYAHLNKKDKIKLYERWKKYYYEVKKKYHEVEADKKAAALKEFKKRRKNYYHLKEYLCKEKMREIELKKKSMQMAFNKDESKEFKSESSIEASECKDESNVSSEASECKEENYLSRNKDDPQKAAQDDEKREETLLEDEVVEKNEEEDPYSPTCSPLILDDDDDILPQIDVRASMLAEKATNSTSKNDTQICTTQENSEKLQEIILGYLRVMKHDQDENAKKDDNGNFEGGENKSESDASINKTNELSNVLPKAVSELPTSATEKLPKVCTPVPCPVSSYACTHPVPPPVPQMVPPPSIVPFIVPTQMKSALSQSVTRISSPSLTSRPSSCSTIPVPSTPAPSRSSCTTATATSILQRSTAVEVTKAQAACSEDTTSTEVLNLNSVPLPPPPPLLPPPPLPVSPPPLLANADGIKSSVPKNEEILSSAVDHIGEVPMDIDSGDEAHDDGNIEASDEVCDGGGDEANDGGGDANYDVQFLATFGIRTERKCDKAVRQNQDDEAAASKVDNFGSLIFKLMGKETRNEKSKSANQHTVAEEAQLQTSIVGESMPSTGSQDLPISPSSQGSQIDHSPVATKLMKDSSVALPSASSDFSEKNRNHCGSDSFVDGTPELPAALHPLMPATTSSVCKNEQVAASVSATAEESKAMEAEPKNAQLDIEIVFEPKEPKKLFCVDEILMSVEAADQSKSELEVIYTDIKRSYNDTRRKTGLDDVPKYYDKTPLAQNVVDKCKDLPLVGLQYVVEVRRDVDMTLDGCYYICALCSKKMNAHTLVAHIKSVPHRLKFSETHCQEIYVKYGSYTLKQWNAPLVKEFTLELSKIEEKMGRHRLAVAYEKDLSCVLASLKEKIADITECSLKRKEKERVVLPPKDIPLPASQHGRVNVAEVPLPSAKPASIDIPLPPVKSAKTFEVNTGKKKMPFDSVKDKNDIEILSPDIKISTGESNGQKFGKRNYRPRVEEVRLSVSRSPSPKRRVFSVSSSRSRSRSPRRKMSPLSGKNTKAGQSFGSRNYSSLEKRKRVLRSPASLRRSRSRSRSRGPRGHRRSRSRSRSRHKSPYRRSERGHRSSSPKRMSSAEQARRRSTEKRLQEFRYFESKLKVRHKRLSEEYEKKPESHPMYNKEWKKFWEMRCTELESEGIDPFTYNFKQDWAAFWHSRVKDLLEKDFLSRRGDQLTRLKLDDPEAGKPLKVSPTPSSHNTTPRPNSQGGSREVVVSRIDRSPSPWENDGLNTHIQNPSPPAETVKQASGPQAAQTAPTSNLYEEEFSVIGTLKILNELEDQLGSFGPAIATLLDKAIESGQKGEDTLQLFKDPDNLVLIRYAREKLSSQISAGILGVASLVRTQIAVERALWLQSKGEKLTRDEKYLGLDITSIAKATLGRDTIQIAQFIAQHLLQVGKSNASEEDLQNILYAVSAAHTKMIVDQATQHAQTPVAANPIPAAPQLNTISPAAPAIETATTPAPMENREKSPPSLQKSTPKPLFPSENHDNKVKSEGKAKSDQVGALSMLQSAYEDDKTEMEKLSLEDMKALLANFHSLVPEEQQALTAYLKKLESTDSNKVMKLREEMQKSARSAAKNSNKVTPKEGQSAGLQGNQKQHSTANTPAAQHQSHVGDSTVHNSETNFAIKNSSQAPHPAPPASVIKTEALKDMLMGVGSGHPAEARSNPGTEQRPPSPMSISDAVMSFARSENRNISDINPNRRPDVSTGPPGSYPDSNDSRPMAYSHSRAPDGPGMGPGPGRGPDYPGHGPDYPGRGPGYPSRGPEGPGRGPDYPSRGPDYSSRGPDGPGFHARRSMEPHRPEPYPGPYMDDPGHGPPPIEPRPMDYDRMPDFRSDYDQGYPRDQYSQDSYSQLHQQQSYNDRGWYNDGQSRSFQDNHYQRPYRGRGGPPPNRQYQQQQQPW